MIDISKTINIQEIKGKKCGLVFITPDTAKAIIENNANPNNRNVYIHTKAKYKADMEAGTFAETTLICFDKNGMLLDGHNRLSALSEAVTDGAWFVVLMGAENDKCVFDRGAARTISQTAKMRGLGVTTKMIAAARVMILLDKYGLKANKNRQLELRDTEVLDYIDEHKDWFETMEMLAPASGTHTRKCMIAAGIMQAFRTGVPQETLKTFAKVLNEGFSNGMNESAAIALKQQLERDYTRGSASLIEFEHSTEEAIMAFVTGTPRKRAFEGKRAPYTEMVNKGTQTTISA